MTVIIVGIIIIIIGFVAAKSDEPMLRNHYWICCRKI